MPDRKPQWGLFLGEILAAETDVLGEMVGAVVC